MSSSYMKKQELSWPYTSIWSY